MSIKNFKTIDDGSIWEILKAISEETGIGIEELIEEVIGINDGLKKTLEAIPTGAPATLRREILKREMINLEKHLDKPYKISIVLELYKKLKDTKYPIKNDLKRLFLDGANYTLTIKPKEKDGFNYEIITREKQQKFDDLIFKPKLKVFLEEVFDQVVNIVDLANIIKEDYEESTIIDKTLLELATEKKIIDTTGAFSKDKDNMEVLAEIKMQLYKKLDEDEEFLREGDARVSSYIKENMQFIDINKFLLMAATRLIIGMKVASGEKIEGITLCDHKQGETTKNTKIFIENIRSELKERAKRNSKVKDLTQSLYNSEDEEIIKVDLKYIDSFLKRFIEDRYITDAEIEEVHRKLAEEGAMPDSKEMYEIAGIGIKDLENISETIEDEKDLVKKEILISSAKELIKYLKETKGLSDEKIIEMYINGVLSQELALDLDFEDEYYIDTFKKLYEENSKEKTPEKTKRLNKFSALCYELSEQGKLDKEELLLEFMESNDKENVYDLYTMGAISLEDCFECIGIEALEKIFAGGNITVQPAILKKMYDSGKLDIKNMVNLINKIPSKEEKYLLIINIFPEELEIRQEIINKTIDVDFGLMTKAITKTKRKKEDETRPEGINFKRHITDSAHRFNLIKNLDVNYYMEMSKDGHVILTLPKFGKIIIEKILDTQNENGYGAATYVLDEKYFDDNEDKIRSAGKINRSVLVEAHKDGNATKFSHSVKTWGDKIKKFFEKISGIPFTDEENKKLDEIIQKIKDSEKLI